MIICSHSIAASAKYAGTGRSELLVGEPYDDLRDLGTILDWDNPIKRIIVHWGSVIGGLEITYKLDDGGLNTVLHGAYKEEANHSLVEIGALCINTEVNGIHGVTHESLGWGNQVVKLSFKICDFTTGLIRSTETFGVGDYFIHRTRKDILVRGLLVGLAGTANNNANIVGLNQVIFYTEVAPGDGSQATPYAA
ncbi:hypothetical protein RhiJN_17281 [Ceratobasidium sp. AG-Ba]|nr:hypothetical protein RhiJN_17281 [Ceratobasidium sp. AG-Ba]